MLWLKLISDHFSLNAPTPDVHYTPAIANPKVEPIAGVNPLSSPPDYQVMPRYPNMLHTPLEIGVKWSPCLKPLSDIIPTHILIYFTYF